MRHLLEILVHDEWPYEERLNRQDLNHEVWKLYSVISDDRSTKGIFCNSVLPLK